MPHDPIGQSSEAEARGQLPTFPIQRGRGHVVPTGKWQHPAYGEMEISSTDVREFVQNVKNKVRKDLPITAGHDNGTSGGELPAIGWLREPSAPRRRKIDSLNESRCRG